LQKIRDEAHRFAISFQRKRRVKKLTSSLLDNIPGIGPIKKKALLHHFTSVDQIAAATREELQQVPHLSSSNIDAILKLFQRER
jgi:excinuclease ABC subunit C